MMPLGNIDLPGDAAEMTSAKLLRFRIIMDSMTGRELDEPSLIGGSRIHRIALGSGSRPEEVRELLKYYKNMKRALKGVRGGAGKFNMQRLMKRFGGM